MSILSWWTGRRRRRHLHKLSKYVDPALVEEYLLQPDSMGAPMQEREVGFLFLRVRDENLDDMDDLICRAAAKARAAGGAVEGLLPPLVVVTFGSVPAAAKPIEESEQQMRAAVAAIRAEIGDVAVILYGVRHARVGHHGGSDVSYFGSFFPGYSDVLRELSTAPIGIVREFKTVAHGGATGSISQEDADSQTRSG